jgi:hypothetical protein
VQVSEVELTSIKSAPNTVADICAARKIKTLIFYAASTPLIVHTRHNNDYQPPKGLLGLFDRGHRAKDPGHIGHCERRGIVAANALKRDIKNP